MGDWYSPTHGGCGEGGGGGDGRTAGGGRGAPGGGGGGLGFIWPPMRLAAWSCSFRVDVTDEVPAMAKIRKPKKQAGIKRYARHLVPPAPRTPPSKLVSRSLSGHKRASVVVPNSRGSSSSRRKLLNVSWDKSDFCITRSALHTLSFLKRSKIGQIYTR